MTILLDKLCFGEGPRWREGMLWFSDMHAQKVLKVDPQGNVETVVKLDDDQPSGLGWLPNGDLLIVAMTKKQVLRFNGSQLSVHADLSSLASHFCNDMVVDHVGRAYVGNFGFDIHNGAQQSAAELICVDVDGSARCVDDDLIFPNGAVITPDNKTLIVAETFASRLTAFDILDSGDLTNKRIWAQLPKGAVPDGICLDAEGGIWSASPTSNNCIRQIEGGEVTHTIELERGAFACMIGEANLYILTSTVSTPAACKANQDARIEVYPAPFRAAGLP
jgi:sugar lactone lactonase YvrE